MTFFGALLSTLPHQARNIVRLQGPDTRRFVQGTVTANIERVPAGEAVSAVMLTVKAKLVTDLVLLLQDEQTIDLLVPRELGNEVEQLLDRHIIMDEVEVKCRQDLELAVVWGADGKMPGLSIDPAVQRWSTHYPAKGELWVGPHDALVQALPESQATPNEFATHRIVEGTPAWGFEVAAGRLPPEIGLTPAISYDKGCFLGQEPLARIHARGQVNRVMVRVTVPETAEPGLLAHPERVAAGELTTVSGLQGLAIVRRSFAVPGTMLSLGELAVQVASGPIGDDPGLGKKSG